MSHTSSAFLRLDMCDSIDILNDGTGDTVEQPDYSSVDPTVISNSYFLELIR